MNIFVIIFWILIGMFCSYIAGQRGRDPLNWFFIGGLFGVFGLILLLILPAVEEEVVGGRLKDEPIPVVAEPLDFEDKEWYYLNSEGEQVGPISFANLISEWKLDVILEETYIWTCGMDQWCRIRDQGDLKLALQNSA